MTRVAGAQWLVGPKAEIALRDRDAGSLVGAPGDRATTEAAVAELQGRLAELQSRLWAEGRRSLLVVLQGTDASGKDGTISHVFSGLDLLGTRVASFKEPTVEELAHDFLWRVHARCPAAGEIVIFNRSHYEDVLAARVRRLVAPEIWRARYAHINAFESLLSDSGTRLVKVFLHISKEEQYKRLQQRLDDPNNSWKVQRSDFDDRELWPAYSAAFEEMLQKTSTDQAPWYVVPADHKWYRNWVVTNIVLETLEEMDPQYPRPAPAGDVTDG
jgi:PPK2 family polyphosphate:nucleotide phosphotransferase